MCAAFRTDEIATSQLPAAAAGENGLETANKAAANAARNGAPARLFWKILRVIICADGA